MEVPEAKSFIYGLNVALDDSLNIVSLKFQFSTKGTKDMVFEDKLKLYERMENIKNEFNLKAGHPGLTTFQTANADWCFMMAE